MLQNVSYTSIWLFCSTQTKGAHLDGDLVTLEPDGVQSRHIRPGNDFLVPLCPVLVSLCGLFLVFSWQEWHPTWSSAVVAHLLHGLMCFRIRGSTLQTLIVTSGYWSCWSFNDLKPVSTFSSDINKIFWTPICHSRAKFSLMNHSL